MHGSMTPLDHPYSRTRASRNADRKPFWGYSEGVNSPGAVARPGTLTAAPLKVTTALNAAELLEAGRR